ncbi:HAMP domain-containing histidine kinase [Parapusillimonas granuli]|uniref:histidine kinase n=2 Tax=Parapusillimonas granuli TaxID=380911 RepID=A0A853FWJ0_9BURK|nr:HAMP domain-containing histidine kinase [Parapusillimonas granuli]
MKPRSISRRVYRAILAVSVVATLSMVVTVLLVNEDLEHTMLDVEFAQERDFILMNHTGEEAFIWDTPELAVVFAPSDDVHPNVLPEVFQGLPQNYSAEIERGDETYLVAVESVSGGVLYIAKNITHFEKREALFGLALIIIAVVILAFSLLLAVFSSRRIVRPLKLLSERISRIPVGPNMPRMESDYSDVELHSIALTFNRFLDELESYVRREQSLLNLASHELRTPIAVMSGALEIIESRNQLSEKDRATLLRVRRSCDEMRDNVNILLKLARRESEERVHEIIEVSPVARQVISDLKFSLNGTDRVNLTTVSELRVKADPAIVGMLLRNIIQNAVQHTKGEIDVMVSETSVEIEDSGTGLSADQQAILMRQKSLSNDGTALSGLGLYIVTLMAERLDWLLDITQTNENGTKIRLSPQQCVNKL